MYDNTYIEQYVLPAIFNQCRVHLIKLTNANINKWVK